MDQEKTLYLKEQLEILVGSKCANIGRSGNLLWFLFRMSDSDFTLDVQSAFRFSDSDRILCSNLDMYEPKKENQEDPDFDYDTFCWDVQGENLFDEWLFSDENHLLKSTVKQILISAYGDLTIAFDNGIKLEVFNNSLGECWRFFERKTKNHIVVNGSGVDG